MRAPAHSPWSTAQDASTQCAIFSCELIDVEPLCALFMACVCAAVGAASNSLGAPPSISRPGFLGPKRRQIAHTACRLSRAWLRNAGDFMLAAAGNWVEANSSHSAKMGSMSRNMNSESRMAVLTINAQQSRLPFARRRGDGSPVHLCSASLEHTCSFAGLLLPLPASRRERICSPGACGPPFGACKAQTSLDRAMKFLAPMGSEQTMTPEEVGPFKFG